MLFPAARALIYVSRRQRLGTKSVGSGAARSAGRITQADGHGCGTTRSDYDGRVTMLRLSRTIPARL